ENTIERIVNIGFFGDQYVNGGGEVVLYWTPPNGQTLANDAFATARLKLRPGDWILLAGNYVNPQSGNIFNRFSWYRVASCDEEVTFNQSSISAPLNGPNGTALTIPPSYQIFATLIGQDWPYNLLQNDQATIVAGVTAVYEKTVRLDYG